ncbi:hypothetical protein N0V95_006306 [Ascochyta clinopodiicola]|nr:hypothetical protein N0V95_006306 [Ascochyta clinopodiicola]
MSKLKRTYNNESSPVSSSSSSSQASEDGVLESDDESPSGRRGCAAVNDMSERQARKINSGSFGMFNRPALMDHLPCSSKLRRKRRRTQEYSEYRGSSRSQPVEPEVLMIDDDEEEEEEEEEEEDEQNLFVPQSASQAQPITIDEDPESDGESQYGGLTPERARKVKEYIHILSIAETAETELRTATDELTTAVAEHATLSQKLEIMHTTADNRIAEIIQKRDEVIRIANEQAEQRIRRVRERVPGKKQRCEESMQDWVKRKSAAEERIAGLEGEVVRAGERKVELERLGGFELCGDVRDAQAKNAGGRK